MHPFTFANPNGFKSPYLFSRGDNLLNVVVLNTLECWLQDQVARKSFHNVSNLAPNVSLTPRHKNIHDFIPCPIRFIIGLIMWDSV